jgi:MOSC domain-containing protein YiiM
MPTLLSVSSSPRHGFSKQPQSCLRLIAGEGIENDAHRGATTQHLYLKRKDPAAPNLAQVHLLGAELLEELAAKGFPLNPGELGENLLTTGIDLLSLPRDTHLHIGAEAILQVTGLRTPCSQIDAFRPGLQALLWSAPLPGTRQKTRRAGIMAIVHRGGVIHPNDAIEIRLPAEPHQPLGPV